MSPHAKKTAAVGTSSKAKAEPKASPAKILAEAALSFLKDTKSVVSWTVRDLAETLQISRVEAEQDQAPATSFVGQFGTVMIAHTGPGLAGLAWWWES